MLTRWSLRRRTLVVVSALLLVLIALNVSGVAPYPGGPMREATANGILWLDSKPADQQGGFEVGVTADGGLTTSDVFVTTVFLVNEGPWGARLENVSLIDGTPGLELLAARLILPGYAGERPGAVWDTPGAVASQYDGAHLGSLPQTIGARSGPNQGNVILQLRAGTPGQYSYRGIRIRYRVGPVSFTADYGQGARLCIGPLAPGATCPGDAPGAAE